MFGHWIDNFNRLCSPGSILPGPFGVIMNIIFFGLILYFLYSLFQAFFTKSHDSEGMVDPDSSFEILKMRFARGEIDAGQYKEMKTELKK